MSDPTHIMIDAAFGRDRVDLLPAVVSRDHLEAIFNQLCLLSETDRLYGNDDDPDTQIFYAPLSLEALFPRIAAKVAESVGEPVAPAFSFLWLYKKGAGIHRHIDRDSAELVASLTVASAQSEAWPIHFEPTPDRQLTLRAEPGDLVLFEGHSVYHWREPSAADWHLQAIFNFVRSSGAYSHFKIDGRAHLGLDPVQSVVTDEVKPVQLAVPQALKRAACGLEAST